MSGYFFARQDWKRTFSPILVMPGPINYIVALYLILVGLIGLSARGSEPVFPIGPMVR